MKIDIVTLFPEFFDIFIKTSIIKRSIEQKLVDIQFHQIRDYSHNKHRNIDDTPYGGGAGMLMAFPPFYDVIEKLRQKDSKVILLSPQGQLFNQKIANSLMSGKHLILLCGHYEGIDARIEELIDLELSVGDYVLTGGEIPAMIVADAINRLIPGVINKESAGEDSLQKGLLKYPQYTKPSEYKGYSVPELLLSGHHKKIAEWRKTQQVKKTLSKRPDLAKALKAEK